MDLEQLLSQKKAVILDKWRQLILESYPADASRFIKQEKDRFINPVGYTISSEIEAIYDELLQEMNSDKLAACLDKIIRIRSVQDFPPSQTIAFTFLLKKAIRDELVSEIAERRTLEGLLEFESRIDRIVLLALDIYMKCREKVHHIRINEMKNEKERALKVLERISSTYREPVDEHHINDRVT